MSIVSELLEGNARFVANDWDPHDRELLAVPAKHLAVVACMDTRYNVEKVLGLSHGDAKIVRNAGPVLDDGTLRSLVVAIHLLEVRHVAILGHTKCGMTVVGRGEFRIAHSLARRAGVPLHEAMRPDFQRWLGGFHDPEEHVRRSVEILRRHPYVPQDVEVFGLLYDNDTGRVNRVAPAAGKTP
ncbi:MAG TPA: carbonic anhydrase [Candidatus Thermoplasmatota archaeon]|nr:carbonic anhydrase [Candidatus Thermoplasmatota archaeon]